MMKFIVAAAVMLFALPGHSGAQDRQIRLRTTRLSAGEIFVEVERQSGLMFAVNHANFDTSVIIALPSEEMPLNGVLEHTLAGTQMTYRIVGQHILIVSRREEKEPPAVFYDLKNKVYTNPNFERDLAAYNKSVGHWADEETVYDSVQVIYVPRVDSVFRYPGADFRAANIGAYPSGALSLRHFTASPALVSVKVNLLYGLATLTPNLAVEVGLGAKTSLDLTASYNPWKLKGTREDNSKLVHWIIRPEFRYWLCERSNGHFFGAHLFYWQYNVSGKNVPMLFEKKYRYEGNAFGAGVSYGYHLPLSAHWGVEFNAGVGAAFMTYDRYSCDKCNRDRTDCTKTYFGPTSLGVKLVYIIK